MRLGFMRGNTWITSLFDSKMLENLNGCINQHLILSKSYSTKSFTPCASISLLIDFQVVKSSFLKINNYFFLAAKKQL